MYNIRKKLMIQPWENLVTDGQIDGRTRVILQNAVRLTSSVQNIFLSFKDIDFQKYFFSYIVL